MCGIVGYAGNKHAKNILLDGLSFLEYRGYDSTGICTHEGSHLECVKAKGKVSELKAKLLDKHLNAHIGIGHTRWATHGIPSTINAHPHVSASGNIAIVHNGIIENYKEVKRKYLEGVKHLSTTDTEVAANLIDYFYLKNNFNLQNAVFEASKILRGSFAILALGTQSPKELVAIKYDTPMIVGVSKGQEEYVFSSDITGILNVTNHIMHIEDNDIVHINHGKMEVTNNANTVQRKINAVNWEHNASTKGDYDHFMMKEIFEQPKSIKQLVNNYIKDDSISFEDSNINYTKVKEAERIYIVGCGSAFYAGLSAAGMLNRKSKASVITEIASEFRYSSPRIDSKTIVIAISQSGETKDTIAAIKSAKDKGAYIVSIVNVLDSSITKVSDSVIYTMVGPEISVASTKSYAGQLVAMYILSTYICNAQGLLSKEDYNHAVKCILQIPHQITLNLKHKDRIEQVSRNIYQAKGMFCLGKREDYISSKECALKIKELSYIYAESIPSGELKHGPLALVYDGMPIIVIATQEELLDKVLSNVAEVKARGAYVVLITYPEFAVEETYYDDVILIDKIENSAFSHINVASTIQLLSYFIAFNKGYDIDQPRNLAKSVTVD